MSARRRYCGFTLAELLVVIGIIAVLLSILIPAIGAVRRRALCAQCQSNLRGIGQALHAYAAEYNGWIIPVPNHHFGIEVPPHLRWPAVVFKIPAASATLPYDPASYTTLPYDPAAFPAAPYRPEILICPSDGEDPGDAHSYLINGHLGERGFRLGSRDLGGRTSDQIILAGEKRTAERDYYLERNEEFDRMVEPFRHGERHGSNYLFIDGHVETQFPRAILGGLDPWDVVRD
jgi:prepilin-type processing-associated H-X9-DG protein/prepilin-type N-terminal cleavage/methylation domain-containing protein